MDYEKKFKDAFERAKKVIEYYKKHHRCDEASIEDLECVFPELKESEDEKIRKTIIRVFEAKKDENIEKCLGVYIDDILSWLEKQKAVDVIDKEEREFADNVDSYRKDMDEFYKKGYNAGREAEKQYWLEKQGEQKQNPYSGTSFEYNGHTFRMCAIDNGVEILMDGELKAFVSSEKSFVYPIHPQPDLAPKNAMEAIKEEKVDNANKIEPKFKVGDYLVNDYCKGKVIALTDDAYLLDTEQGIPFSCEHNAHLWTIQDAKDGDVLACENGWTCIFNYLNDNLFSSHCFMDSEGWFCEDGGQGHTLDKRICGEIHPATKKQRDLLFQKIHEAGYKWDAEKKELKKIHVIDEGKSEMDYCFTKMMNGERVSSGFSEEYEEVNGEDYGIDGLWNAKRILEKTLGEVEGYQTDDGILEHKAAITAVKKLYEQKSWTEEDEEELNQLHKLIVKKAYEEYEIDTEDETLYGKWLKLDNWLKSLKPQPQWKPSEEQIDVLNMVITDEAMDDNVKTILKELIIQIKKL